MALRPYRAIIDAMTVEEKIDLLAASTTCTCAAYTPRRARMRMIDGPMGVRSDGRATAFAAASRWPPAGTPNCGTHRRRVRPGGARQGCAFPAGARRQIYRGLSPGGTSSTWARSVPRQPHRRRLHRGRAEPGRERHGEALRRQQYRVRPQSRRLDRRRTHAARDLPSASSSGQGGAGRAIMAGYNLTNGEYMSSTPVSTTKLRRASGHSTA